MSKSGESNGERVATIGSPSTTTSLSLEIFSESAKRKLVGELIWFEFKQDNVKHYTLGQITEVELRNFMLEFSEIRSLARQRGNVNPVSGMQDTHRGLMTPGAVFKRNEESYVPGILGTVPPTGTEVYKADEDMLGKLLGQYQDKMFRLGNFYESGLRLPLWFHHFGPPEEGGAGEAYHIGIYGMTGSGKSTLAKTIMMAYMKHRTMAMFVLDQSGEFKISATGQKGQSGGLFVDIKMVADRLGRRIVTKHIGDLALDRWDLFKELLYESTFFERLTVSPAKREYACDVLTEHLSGSKHGKKVKLADLHKKESYDKAMKILGDQTIQEQIYLTPDPRKRLAARVESPPDGLYEKSWMPAARLFDKRRRDSVESLVRQTFDLRSDRPIVIIDLSETGRESGMLWNDKIRATIIYRIVGELMKKGEEAYKGGEFLNTLVILDEAQRLVPREKFEEERQNKLRDRLINAAQTTRKYGLGWMFISLSLSTLHREIYHSNRISFYGFGLSSGYEMATLKEVIADKNALKLYQSFKDPHAVEPRFRTYSFMSRGPVSPLSSSGTPLFLTMFNAFEKFLTENGIT